MVISQDFSIYVLNIKSQLVCYHFRWTWYAWNGHLHGNSAFPSFTMSFHAYLMVIFRVSSTADVHGMAGLPICLPAFWIVSYLKEFSIVLIRFILRPWSYKLMIPNIVPICLLTWTQVHCVASNWLMDANMFSLAHLIIGSYQSSSTRNGFKLWEGRIGPYHAQSCQEHILTWCDTHIKSSGCLKYFPIGEMSSEIWHFLPCYCKRWLGTESYISWFPSYLCLLINFFVIVLTCN